jgi:hypothetical protein
MVRPIAGLLLVALLLSLNPATSSAQDMTLDYCCRYNHQSGEPDHLMTAMAVGSDRAIVAGNRGLALIDLSSLPPQGTTNYIYRLSGLNARDLYPAGDGYIFVNLHGTIGGESGFAIVRLVGNTLQHVDTYNESPEVFYEKMCVSDGYLFVAAHSYGLRIFSITNPAAPVLVGSLDGLVDAFAVDVNGGMAYVADGAGGLKVVDVSDPTVPVLLDGEDLETAVGTSEDVAHRNDRVFVAAGGAGLAVYDAGDPTQRTLVETGGCAESLCWIGDLLAVGTLGGVRIYDVTAEPLLVASEVAARRGNGILRICSDVGTAPGNRLLCANWNYMDVYELKPAGESTQPDITPSVQRIRFAPEGGSKTVSLRNDGAGPLNITGVNASPNSFSVDYSGGTLMPGESVEFDISYNGSPSQGTGLVSFASNDPDESPLPIQVFGNTQHLDPGEPAVDFTLPLLTRNHETGEFTEEPFMLSDHVGKVVWFQVYASW